MVASLVLRGLSFVARPVINLGGRAIRFVRARPVTAAATAGGVAATQVGENVIDDIADDVTSGGVKFAIGAGIVWGVYVLATSKRLRGRLKKIVE